MEPWTSDSHTTTHIHDGNGNADYVCFDIDLDDHQATCVNGENHEDATKNDDGSDGALATTLGYGAIAAAALLA